MVFDIKKFAIHDGPGIRTTVFMKGCPLKCLWCHNPESQCREPEISFIPEKCIGCGWCFQNCPMKGHVMEDCKHVLHRENCIRCGKCAEKCYAGANTLIGREMEVQEVMAEVMKDLPFYENSGGGMTISGGEPMMQFDFTAALLREAKNNRLHNCLDTCGFAPAENYRKIMDCVDIFLYDVKETDPSKHELYTGVPLDPILKNLRMIDAAGGVTVLRCPIIPGLNDRKEHLQSVGRIAASLKHVQEINLMPYHPLGESKLQRIGKSDPLQKHQFADEKAVDSWLDWVRGETNVPVSRG